MAEQHNRKRAREMLSKSGYSSGGHFAREAVGQHEEHDHPKEKRTKIKFADGGSVPGLASGGRADRAPRGRHKGKGSKTVVNVLNLPHPGGGAPGAGSPPIPRPPMPPPGAMAGPPPPLGGPAGPPGMPPGGPMKRGGRATAEAGSDSWRNPIKGANGDQAKRGGKAHKSKRPHAKYKRGGKVAVHLTGGAGGARGRLEKAEAEAKSEGGKRACGGKS